MKYGCYEIIIDAYNEHYCCYTDTLTDAVTVSIPNRLIRHICGKL